MRQLLALFLAACAAACAQARADEPPAAPPPAAGAHHGSEMPDHFTNLKVLPKDIKKDDLLPIMRSMSAGLGVKCAFCHVMEPKKDWAADTKKKDIARGMMKMTERINKEMFTWPDAPKATCYMCHHGAEEPKMKPPPREGAAH